MQILGKKPNSSMALRSDGRTASNRWTLAELDRIGQNEDELLTFLDRQHIVPLDRSCPKCFKPNMRIEKRANNSVSFRCGKRINPGGSKCSGQVGLLTSFFLARSKVPAIVVLKLVYMWLANMELTKICDEIAISSETAVEWSRFCRRAVYYGMISLGESICGPGDVVEIDESKFGKRKYNRGHHVEGFWVFGGISRTTGGVFTVQVKKRDRATLLPLCQRWIKPGSIVIADCWRAYDTLEEIIFQLLRVNHSITFKTTEEKIPDCFSPHVRKAVHANSIEAFWGAVKRMIFRQLGNRTRRHLPGNLAKYLFIKQCRLRNSDPFLKMIQLCVKMNRQYDSKHCDDTYRFSNDESSSEDSEVEFTQHESQSQCVVYSQSPAHSPSRIPFYVSDEVKVPFGKGKKMYRQSAVIISAVEDSDFADDKCTVQFGDNSIAVYKRNKFSQIRRVD